MEHSKEPLLDKLVSVSKELLPGPMRFPNILPVIADFMMLGSGDQRPLRLFWVAQKYSKREVS